MTYHRRVYFEPGYNKRAEGKGIHGMGIRFLFVGPLGATVFHLNTGWVPDQSMAARVADLFPSGYDVGHHWLTPTYEGEYQHDGPCMFLGGRNCYYDGSGLAAESLLDEFIKRGEPAVWRELIRQYRRLAAEVVAI